MLQTLSLFTAISKNLTFEKAFLKSQFNEFSVFWQSDTVYHNFIYRSVISTNRYGSKSSRKFMLIGFSGLKVTAIYFAYYR